MDRYVERYPHNPALKGIVICYYEMLTPARDMTAVPIIPDASVDLVWVDNGARVNSYVTIPAASLVGLHAKGAQRVLGVRLMPGAISRLWDVTIGSIAVPQIALGDLNARGLPAGDRIHALTFSQFVVEIERWLTSALAAHHSPAKSRETLMRYCVARMLASGGNVAVHTLARETGYSDRHINTIFHLYTGLSPKELAHVARLQNAISRLNDTHPPTLASISQASGYYDQSHMNKAFLSLLNTTPAKLGQHDFFAADGDSALMIAFQF